MWGIQRSARTGLEADTARAEQWSDDRINCASKIIERPVRRAVEPTRRRRSRHPRAAGYQILHWKPGLRRSTKPMS